MRRGTSAPPGFSAKTEAGWTLAALGAAFLWSLGGPIRIKEAWDRVRDALTYGMKLLEPEFSECLGVALYGFGIVAAGLIVLAAWHYASFYQGARSDYLMRRLPNRWELHTRCLLVPVMGLLLTAILAATAFFAYRAYFFHCQSEFYEFLARMGGTIDA